MRVDENDAIFWETSWSNRHHWFWTLFIARFGVLVPCEPLAITANCDKGVELLIEGNMVYGIDIAFLWVTVFLPVTFEAKVSAINFGNVIKVNIHNTASSFNRSDSVTFTITKARNSTWCESERTFSDVNRIVIVVEDIFKVPNVNEFFRMSCHHKWELPTHLMNRLANPRFSN